MISNNNSEHLEKKDPHGAKLGMWLFLFTEIILFGGLFVLYAVYLARYPAEFAQAAHRLDIVLGGTNTVVLLTSSLFVALAVTAVQQNKKNPTILLLFGTVVSALLFLGIKYVEWSAKIGHGIYPDSAMLNEMARGEIIFFGLYFVTTGLHGLHVMVGLFIILIMAVRVRNGSIHGDDFIQLEICGLYWHLVDLIWIFIFPLYYLLL